MNLNTSAAGSGQTTATPVSTAPANGVAQRPEWTRLPKAGSLCWMSGLSRSKLNQLILPCAENNYHPPVRSVVLRQPGRIKGVRLIHVGSLLAYIEAQSADRKEAA